MKDMLSIACLFVSDYITSLLNTQPFDLAHEQILTTG
jgi:hypothetical protein